MMMNVLSPLAIAAPPVLAATVVLAQAAAGAEGATGFGVAKLITETVVGASILMTVILFLRDRTADRSALAEALRQRDIDREENDRRRDEAMKSIADDFRGDIKKIVERFEGNQNQLVGLTREAITALASHDATIKELGQRQQRLEMVVYHEIHAPARVIDGPEGIAADPDAPTAGGA